MTKIITKFKTIFRRKLKMKLTTTLKRELTTKLKEKFTTKVKMKIKKKLLMKIKTKIKTTIQRNLKKSKLNQNNILTKFTTNLKKQWLQNSIMIPAKPSLGLVGAEFGNKVKPPTINKRLNQQTKFRH